MNSKKICVVTWIDGYNYGTVLQAFALTQYLEKLGFEVDFLRNANSKVYYIAKPSALVDRIIFRIINRVEFIEEVDDKVLAMNQMQVFEKFRIDKFHFIEITNLSDLKKIQSDYSAFIVGSDQLWNPYHYHPIYFLNFVKNAKKIAYSPSLGVESLSKCIQHKYRKYLKDFNAIGVREKQAAKLLKNISPVDVKVNLDPVLLLDYSFWLSIANESVCSIESKLYALCYFVENKKNYLEYVKKIYQKYGIDIIWIPMHEISFDLNYIKEVKGIGPSDFLKLIKNAQVVYTDSFHASCFSIIFKKEFYVLKRFNDSNPKSENSKIYNLLSEFGLDTRLVKSDHVTRKKINYDFTYTILERRRVECQNFLLDAIGE